MSNPHVYIAIPSYTGMIASSCVLGVVSLIDTIKSEGGNATLTFHSFNGNVADARNHLARGFLESDASHLLFIDDDMGFRESDIMRMLDAVADNPRQVVAALCPRKNRETGAGDYDCYSPITPAMHGTDSLLGVTRVGTGIMLIPREALQAVLDFGVVDTNKADGLVQFFVTKMGAESLGEDYYFCDMCTAAGIEVSVAMWTTSVTHTGLHTYKGII